MPEFYSQNTVVTEHDLVAGVSTVASLVQLSMVVEVYLDPCLIGVLVWQIYTFPHSQGMLYVPGDLRLQSSFTGRSSLEIFLGDRPTILI